MSTFVLLSAPRSCRNCGCTDDDCSECIEAAGAPCYWISDDLCSRCLLIVDPDTLTFLERVELAIRNGDVSVRAPHPIVLSATWLDPV